MGAILRVGGIDGNGCALADGSAMATERLSTSSLAAPPAIAPLPEGDGRPFWSVMIPVYNAPEAYLRETLRSVLGQAPDVGQMQIEVVDNCSTEGDPEAVVREVGGDRVRFHRQPENLGMVENFNSCIRRATGHWVHILHGDDAVRPGFYAGLRVGIEVNPEVGAAACRIIYIDEDGHWTGLSELEARTRGVLDGAFATRQLIDQRLQFAGIVVRRSVYERVGGFLSLFVHCLDWDMWKRVTLCTPIYYEPEPLACYRMHSGADSSRLYRTGANVVDERRSIDVTCSAFPSAEAKRLRRAARKAAGMRAARRARALWKIGHRLAAWRQAVEALRCSFAPAVVARTVYFVVRTIVR